MKRPSVLLAAESLAPGQGGVARVARMMARTLAGEAAAGRIQARAVVFRDEAAPALGLPTVCCGGSRLRFVLAVRRALWTHTHAIYDFAGMGRAHEALRRSSVPSACWIHGIDVWEPVRPDYLAVLRRAERILSNSRYTAARAAALHPFLGRAEICWLATESDEPPPRPPAPAEPTVLIVGRIDAGHRPEWPRYKGHDALIRCWPEVVRRAPGARLVIVGDGPGRAQIEAMAHASSARDRINLRGFVPEAELDEHFARARVFAMPSRGEGFGLVYIEAMRHGLPVIASRHDAAPEVNLDGVTGFNVDLDDPSALPARVGDLLVHPDRAAAMGAAGRQRWHEHFRFSSFRSRLLRILAPWWQAAGPRSARALISHAGS